VDFEPQVPALGKVGSFEQETGDSDLFIAEAGGRKIRRHLTPQGSGAVKAIQY
jgi:hypothetical protein